jgi:hypothetical protein
MLADGISKCSKNKNILTVSSYTFGIIHTICKQIKAFKIFTVFNSVTTIPSAKTSCRECISRVPVDI